MHKNRFQNVVRRVGRPLVLRGQGRVRRVEGDDGGAAVHAHHLALPAHGRRAVCRNFAQVLGVGALGSML
jgi:hypothetical protein